MKLPDEVEQRIGGRKRRAQQLLQALVLGQNAHVLHAISTRGDQRHDGFELVLGREPPLALGLR